MSSSDDFQNRLGERLKKIDVQTLIDLLQQDRSGKVKSMSDDQIQTIHNSVDWESKDLHLTEDDVESLLDKVRSSENLSDMTRFDVKQLVDWAVTLSDDEFEDTLFSLVPLFSETTPNFIESFTSDQLAVSWEFLWPRLLKHLEKTGDISKVLMKLYSASDIGRAIKCLQKKRSSSEKDEGDNNEKEVRRRRRRRKTATENSEVKSENE